MTSVGRFKKGLAVVLASLMILTMLPGGLLKVEAAGEKTTLNIGDGSIVIGDGTVKQNGESLTYNANGYIITGNGTSSNTISVTGGSQDITLNGVNIDVSAIENSCAFSIASGASVNLTLSSVNTLRSGSGHAGLEVPRGTSVNIAGADEDSLEASGGEAGAGIGGIFRSSSGRIMITGGTVTANGGRDCAGIGSGGNTDIAGTIIISGGIVTASGTYAAGIGGYCGPGGNIIITGGMITSTGGNNSAGIGGNYSEGGCNIEISGGTIHATGGTGYTYFGGAGIGGGHSGDGGTVTISGGTITAVGKDGGAGIGCSSTAEGQTCDGGNVTISGGEVMAIGGSGGAGIGTGLVKSGSCSGSTITISGGTVTATGGGGGADIGAGSGAAPCTAVIIGGSVKATSVSGNVTDGNGNTEHCVTVTDLTATVNVNASVNGGKIFSCETDSSGQLYLWMAAGNNKATICCGDIYYGANAAVSDANTSTAAGAMEVLDLSWGDITISDGSFSGKDSDGDAASANTYGYVITASSDVEGQTVSVSGGSDSIVLQNVMVNNKDYSISPVSVTGTASVYLTLSGNNTLQSYYAGVEVTGDATVSITGTDDDFLNANSTNYGAGIGGNGDGTDANNCGTVTISGGNITALGARNCAGIGGAYLTASGSGGNVTISGGTVDAEGGASAAGIGGSGNGGAAGITVTGGTVTAVGSDGGAGIGGGMHESGTVTITGGTVTSTAVEGTLYKLCGSGIGNGYGGSGSTVKISGGSVNTPSISGTPTSDGSTHVYPTTVTLPSGNDVSNLSITQGSSVTYGINDMQTDSNGTLYLYLPAYTDGDTTVSVTADGTAYNGYHGTVKTSGTQASPNVLKMNQSALSFQNTDTQTFTYGDTISLDTAVTGGTLSGTVSYTYSGTDKLGNTYTAGTACPTNAGDGNYTITATLPGNSCYYNATATKAFIINQEDISTSGVTVAVASATYTGQALSPVITATFGSNTLGNGTDFDVYDETGSTENPTYTDAGSCNILIKGTGNYTGSVIKSFAIAQKAIALTLTASQSEAKAGGSVNLAATVSSGAVNLPTGTVTFKYGSTTIASGIDITESDGKYTAQTTWSNVPAGEYNITAEYAPTDNDNYACCAAATIDGYSITKYDQTGFGFQDETISKTYGDDAFTLAASGGQSSGIVTYQSSDTGVATVTGGGMVTIKSVGAVTITTKKASDSTYNEAVDTVTVNIGKAATSIKTAPTASNDISVVGKLSSVALKGGKGGVTGSFEWTNPDTVVSGNGEYEVTFTPTNSNYTSCTCKVKVTVTPVITNSGTGVQYDLTNTNLPDGVTSVSVHSSVVSGAGSGSSAYSIVNKLIDGSTSSASSSATKLYNLSLMDQGNQAVTGFTGKITVRIPIPDGMSGDLHVYWYNDADGTVTDMNARQENGYLAFETTHFSYYAIAELSASVSSASGTTPNPNTGSDSFPFISVALLGISGCGLVVVTRGRRFKKKN